MSWSVPRQFTRTLSITSVVVLAAIAAMAIVGWTIAATSHNSGHRSFAVSVVNDRGEEVSIQPCARFFCDKFRPVDLPAGASHTWQTTDGDAGVHSFVVNDAPRGRILGCLAEHGLNGAAGQVSVRVTELERCIS